MSADDPMDTPTAAAVLDALIDELPRHDLEEPLAVRCPIDGEIFHVDHVDPDGHLRSAELEAYIAHAAELRRVVADAYAILEAARWLSPAGLEALARIETLERLTGLEVRDRP